MKIQLNEIAAKLDEQLYASWQYQVDETGHKHFGMVINPEHGLPDSTHTFAGPMVWAAGLLYLYEQNEVNAQHLERAKRLMEGILKLQRPSGLIDFLECNIDSSPDTAFLVQQLGSLPLLAQTLEFNDENWEAFASPLRTLLGRTIPGVRDGGFHTPNHRWVITSALSILNRLFDRPDCAARIESYITEEVDIEEEGYYIEKSSGGYDAVSNISFLLIDELYGWEAGLAAVKKNLDLNATLLHDDATIESSHSTRWDNLLRHVPPGLASTYLQYGFQANEAMYCDIAIELFNRRVDIPISALCRFATSMMMTKQYEIEQSEGFELPVNQRVFYPKLGLGREKQESVSVSYFLRQRNLATAIFGDAGMRSLLIRFGYFGPSGDFIAHEVSSEAGQVQLSCDGEQLKPAQYWQASGKPVNPDDWEDSLPVREVRPMPACNAELTMKVSADGMAFHLKSDPAIPDGVLTQIMMDFEIEGIWEGEGLTAGEVILLEKESSVMAYPNVEIEINGGKCEHRASSLRDGPPATPHARLAINLLTPVDHRWSLNCK